MRQADCKWYVRVWSKGRPVFQRWCRNLRDAGVVAEIMLHDEPAAEVFCEPAGKVKHGKPFRRQWDRKKWRVVTYKPMPSDEELFT